MVSKYDVFYVIATKGEVRVIDIVKALNKPEKEYQVVFNKVLELEREKYVERKANVKVLHNEKSIKLFKLLLFCTNNLINYNLILKKEMIRFIEKALRKEFFAIKDVQVHPKTFSFYVDALFKYGFLIILSRKPLKCKLLRHHFLIDLMKFFGKKTSLYTSKKHSFIKEIKKELRRYRTNLKINPLFFQELEKKNKANFIYSSLHLEGNPLTLPETQKLILEDVIPEKQKLVFIKEITNYEKAIELMMKNANNRLKLTLNLILHYHGIAMAHIDGAGALRTQNVIIKLNPKFKTCDWSLIQTKLSSLLDRYNLFELRKRKIREIIKFASFFHNEFQRIHPFIDGNSRMARLLMLHILRSHKIPVLDLPIGYFDLYLDLTKRSTKRDDATFNILIEEIVFTNLKHINLKIGAGLIK